MADRGTTFSRRVSFNEKLYLATDGQPGGFCVQLVVQGTGTVAFDALVAAVERAAGVHPGARLVLRGVLGGARWVAAGPSPAVRRRPAFVDDAAAWSGPEALGPRLDPRRGPTCEVVLHEGERPALVFRCHHAVMDARGLLDFVVDVFAALRGEDVAGSDGTVTDTELVQQLAGRRTRPLLRGDRRNVLATRAARRSAQGARSVVVRRAGQALVARVALALARFATQHHATPTRVMIPVDLRNYAPKLRASGNLTLPLFVDVDAAIGPRALQAAIVRRLVARDPLRLDPWERLGVWLPLAAIRLIFGLWTTTHRLRGRFPASVVVSHVVAPPCAQLSAPGFAAAAVFVVPMADHFLPLVVAITSVGDDAHLVVTAPRALAGEARLDEIAAAIAVALQPA